MHVSIARLILRVPAVPHTCAHILKGSVLERRSGATPAPAARRQRRRRETDTRESKCEQYKNTAATASAASSSATTVAGALGSSMPQRSCSPLSEKRRWKEPRGRPLLPSHSSSNSTCSCAPSVPTARRSA
eukprot:scaffold15072_cov68-Phaeocystis_antarctica.AAC.5